MKEYPRYRFEAVMKDGRVLIYEGESAFEITSAYGMGSGQLSGIDHVIAKPLNEAAKKETQDERRDR